MMRECVLLKSLSVFANYCLFVEGFGGPIAFNDGFRKISSTGDEGLFFFDDLCELAGRSAGAEYL